MRLTEHSKNSLMDTFAQWEVPRDFADPLYNYLVHGFHPGTFWYNVLINDFAKAMLSSHPGNTVPALKAAVGWMNNTLEHGVAWGDYHAVEHWLQMTSNERRAVLETNHLVYTEREEVILILKDTPTHEPILW